MGLSPRLRFKWEKMKSALRSALEPKKELVASSHRMCPSCRALIDRSARVCPHCGVETRPARARGGPSAERIAGIIPVPSTASSSLVAANIALYAVAWYLTQSSASPVPAGGVASGAVRGEVLFRLGAKFGPAIFAGEWWRLVTAIFLHAGLLHIAMNLWCLIDLGPQVESLFTTAKFIVIYLVTGISSFLLSLWYKPLVLSIGASGAIFGLIGVLIGASFHHGHLGKAYRSQLWRWVVYMLIFGLFFSVDNAAHIGGLASGLVFGYFIPEGEPLTRAGENLWSVLAVLSVLVIAGSFVMMALQLNRPLG